MVSLALTVAAWHSSQLAPSSKWAAWTVESVPGELAVPWQLPQSVVAPVVTAPGVTPSPWQ